MTAATRASIALIIGSLCRGQDYDQLLRTERAIDLIPKLRAAPPDDRQAALALGVSYYIVRQHRLFERQMRALIAALPEDPAPYYYLGRYQDADLGDFQAAARSFREVLQRRPGHAKALYYLGHALEAQGQTAEARRCYLRAGDLALARDGLARLSLAEGDAALALAHQPEDLKLRGRILMRLERWDEAARALRQAADADTTDSAVWFLLHRAYRRLGHGSDAVEALERYRLLSRTYQ